tara:strand:+ start:669 stop:1235 length:567 start_codon:yes stop_codon:yes gene_type:complete
MELRDKVHDGLQRIQFRGIEARYSVSLFDSDEVLEVSIQKHRDRASWSGRSSPKKKLDSKEAAKEKAREEQTKKRYLEMLRLEAYALAALTFLTRKRNHLREGREKGRETLPVRVSTNRKGQSSGSKCWSRPPQSGKGNTAQRKDFSTSGAKSSSEKVLEVCDVELQYYNALTEAAAELQRWVDIEVC